MLLIDKNWLIRIWSDIKGAQDEIIRLLLNVSDCLHVFAWMKFHPRMYLSLSKRQGWNFILEWKEKKKSCFENFCSLKKKGPYPSFLSEQRFSKQYFQKTAFVIISLKFWNNQWNSRKNFIKVNMLGLHIWNSKLTRKNREKW